MQDLYASLVLLQQYWSPCVMYGHSKLVSTKQFLLQNSQPPFDYMYPIACSQIAALFFDTYSFNKHSLAYGMCKFIQDSILQKLPVYLQGIGIVFVVEVMKQFVSTNKLLFDQQSIGNCLDVLLHHITNLKKESITSKQLLVILCNYYHCQINETSIESIISLPQHTDCYLQTTVANHKPIQIYQNILLQQIWQPQLLEKYVSPNTKYSIAWSESIKEEVVKENTFILIPTQKEPEISYLDYLYYHHMIPIPKNSILQNCTEMEFDTQMLKLYTNNSHCIVLQDPVLHHLLQRFFKIRGEESHQFSTQQLYTQLYEYCYSIQNKDQIILEKLCTALRDTNVIFPEKLGIAFFESVIMILKLCFSVQNYFII